MNDDNDVTFAATAFAAALPPLEFRPAAKAAPRRHHRGPAALTASVATVAAVAVTTTALMSSGTNAPTAWSATPKHLSSTASESIDQRCRAAKSPDSAVIHASGTPGKGSGQRSGPQVKPSGVIGHGVERGVVTSDSGGPTPVTPSDVPPTTRVGNLPLILVVARGNMTLALYGDAEHHVICTLDPDGRAMITPDAGAWKTGDLIDGAATLGSESQSADGTTSSSMKLLGTTAANVTGITVDVPKVGTVEATVGNGHYALFVPQALLGKMTSQGPKSFRAADWKAHVTTSDGTVQDTTIMGALPPGAAPNPG